MIAEKNHGHREVCLLTEGPGESPGREESLNLSSGGWECKDTCWCFAFAQFSPQFVTKPSSKQTRLRASCNVSCALLKNSPEFSRRQPCCRTSVEHTGDFACLRYRLSPPLNCDLYREWQWFSFTSHFPLVRRAPLKSRAIRE